MVGRLVPRLQLHDQLMAAVEWDGHGRQAERGWKFLTLTTPKPAGEDPAVTWSRTMLRRRIDAVREAWKLFWRSTPWGRQVHGENGKRSRRDTSAIRSIEIGAGGMVHLHVLVYGEYVDQAEIQSRWEAALGVPRAIAHIRAADTHEGALRELVAYAAKGPSEVSGEEAPRLDPRRAANVELALRSVHRISMSGAIRGVKVTAWDRTFEDVTVEDVHDHKVAACEDCGTIGEWKWIGPVDAAAVRFNKGYGRYRHQRTFEDVLAERSEVSRSQPPQPSGLAGCRG